MTENLIIGPAFSLSAVHRRTPADVRRSRP